VSEGLPGLLVLERLVVVGGGGAGVDVDQLAIFGVGADRAARRVS
jgi:hypothetical protein